MLPIRNFRFSELGLGSSKAIKMNLCVTSTWTDNSVALLSSERL